jgi:hypothetical protein
VTTQDNQPIFEQGDVVFGTDPFKRAEAARPWLVLSAHEDRPFHGDQYISVTLTTKSWMDGLIELAPEHWLRGGTPAESRIVPWGVQSVSHEDIDRWQGRLEDDIVAEAVEALVGELDG